jgi:hypothetical protein
VTEAVAVAFAAGVSDVVRDGGIERVPVAVGAWNDRIEIAALALGV